MSKASEYAALKRRIEQYESDHPDLVVLAVEQRIAVPSNAPPPAEAPLGRVYYKAESDEIWLQIAPGFTLKGRSNVPWNPNLVDVKVYPHRLRVDGQPSRVIFEELDF
ncbi:Uncharacterised protein [Achromobacter xylosoxidans]|uniref:hypothetical protein n=1 Tax=Achromobacter TaxID=222 RepID=UPI0006C199AF|nr:MULTISPECIES: hypothetical protein [Achromobacter]CAB3920110.1 hypothetical protein LMG26846_05533 [Achromobacter insuavis]CUJ39621.1 Uncharacterised protein [Achromobacter sp. 2789STDY5608621]CUJ45069.1 Uncharacterised protein [Achromobacter xylosoxidans]